MSNYEHITYEPRGGVTLITLKRLVKLNAWTPKMELEFIDAINTAAGDGEIGCVVITGAGRGFCAGADIGNWDRGLKNGGTVRRSKMLNEGGSPEVPIALSLGKPAIAAINGVSVGVGLTMTLACDIRIASTAARFSARFVKVGLTPECGSTRYLPLVAGLPNALFLALTGRIIGAPMDLAERIIATVAPHAAVRTIHLVGSRAEGRATEFSDWDFRVDARDFNAAARALPQLLAPLEPLAQQWDRLSPESCWMLIL